MACRQDAQSCPAGNIRSEREVPELLNRLVERGWGERCAPDDETTGDEKGSAAAAKRSPSGKERDRNTLERVPACTHSKEPGWAGPLLERRNFGVRRIRLRGEESRR
jgi:hypothetical protein